MNKQDKALYKAMIEHKCKKHNFTKQFDSKTKKWICPLCKFNM